MNSIRSRLLLGLMLALSAALLALLAANWVGARRELGALFDAHLQQSAAIVLLWTQTEPRQGEALNEQRFRAEIRSLLPLMQGVSLRGRETQRSVEQQRDLAYAIVCEPTVEPLDARSAESASRTGEQRVCIDVVSPNAPAFLRKPSAAAGFSLQQEGEAGAAAAAAVWHVYTVRDADQRFTVRVAERDDVRRRLIAGIVLRQLAVTLPILPLAGVLVWLVIGRGLRPLRRLSEQISGRREQLLQPVSAVAPDELKLLVDALNRLFRSADRAFERERRFSAAVAHELRTPLSVIRTRAEVAAAQAADEDVMAAFSRIIAQCERASRVLDQLLELARVENDSVQQQRRRVDMPALAREVMADLSPQADMQGVELVLTAATGLPPLYAEPVSLSILLRNLLENAIRHSPPGAEVEVAVDGSQDDLLMRVCDQGEGMSPGQRAAFEALMRAEPAAAESATPQADQTGFGLGLLLVQRIALLHGAHVSLSPPAATAGLCIELRFVATGSGAKPATPAA